MERVRRHARAQDGRLGHALPVRLHDELDAAGTAADLRVDADHRVERDGLPAAVDLVARQRVSADSARKFLVADLEVLSVDGTLLPRLSPAGAHVRKVKLVQPHRAVRHRGACRQRGKRHSQHSCFHLYLFTFSGARDRESGSWCGLHDG